VAPRCADLGFRELEPDGSGTRVRYTWTLSLHTRWRRLAAPLMVPVFRWNHEGVMRSGGQGLARWPARRPALRAIAS